MAQTVQLETAYSLPKLSHLVRHVSLFLWYIELVYGSIASCSGIVNGAHPEYQCKQVQNGTK